MERHIFSSYKLRFQEIFQLDDDCSDGFATKLGGNLKHSDLVGRERQVDLVKLLGRVLVDRQQHASVVKRLRRVFVRPVLVPLASAIKLPLVRRLQRPRQVDPSLAAGRTDQPRL